MDWNRIEGNWKQTAGKIKEKWGKLTEEDLDVIAGRRDRLEGAPSRNELQLRLAAKVPTAVRTLEIA